MVKDAVVLPAVNVITVEAELALKYKLSAALVAVIKQVPTEVTVSESTLETAHPEAVPPAFTEKVMEPDPEPPDVVNLRGVPNTPEAEVILNAD